MKTTCICHNGGDLYPCYSPSKVPKKCKKIIEDFLKGKYEPGRVARSELEKEKKQESLEAKAEKEEEEKQKNINNIISLCHLGVLVTWLPSKQSHRVRFPEVAPFDYMAEWLRRWTANPLGSARAGSNPVVVVF
tara:strand:- start:254 stop:655 length:402 start_codon:yes stop_codon:yes gene_type:complete